MKLTTCLLISTIYLVSCGNATSNMKDRDAAKGLTLKDLEKDFKFSSLAEFEIDSFSWETRPGKYKELDSITFYMVWQDSKRTFSGKGYDRDYLFSWQDRDTNFIEFTILTQDENGYCNIINYNIYDKKGEFIDKFSVSATCGDGGWVYTASGKFIDKTTFEQICVETEMTGVDSLDIREWREGDSTMLHYIIEPNGKVTEKEIYKKHFTAKW